MLKLKEIGILETRDAIYNTLIEIYNKAIRKHK